MVKFDILDGFILTLNLSDKSSLKETEESLSKIIKGYPSSVIILIGTKSDLNRKISMEEAINLSERSSCLHYFETSTNDQETMEKPFLRLFYYYSGTWFPETIWKDLANGKKITAKRRESKAPQKGKRKSCLLM